MALKSVWLMSLAWHARGLRSTGNQQRRQLRTTSFMATQLVMLQGDGVWEDIVTGLGDLPQVALGTWCVNMEKVKDRLEVVAKT